MAGAPRNNPAVVTLLERRSRVPGARSLAYLRRQLPRIPMPSDIQTPPIRQDGLQLSEDRVLQRSLWRSQRVGWISFGLLLLAALGGLTGGGGPFSSQRVVFPGATVQLPLVARWKGSEKIVVAFEKNSAGEVGFGSGFTDAYSVENITPEPGRSRLEGKGIAFAFEGAADGKREAFFTVRPSAPGWFSFAVEVAGDRRPVWTFILP